MNSLPLKTLISPIVLRKQLNTPFRAWVDDSEIIIALKLSKIDDVNCPIDLLKVIETFNAYQSKRRVLLRISGRSIEGKHYIVYAPLSVLGHPPTQEDFYNILHYARSLRSERPQPRTLIEYSKL